MRWGIPSDANEYHGTYDLCKKEIADSQELSIGPNFVVSFIENFTKFYFLNR